MNTRSVWSIWILVFEFVSPARPKAQRSPSYFLIFVPFASTLRTLRLDFSCKKNKEMIAYSIVSDFVFWFTRICLLALLFCFLGIF
ncbi:hypothetical protein DRQ00_05105 [candidate division KSB1 bacterium]|nr:MAG: hypothetical protein DRQ00_05105 [candidate division KSB1 bacterium]